MNKCFQFPLFYCTMKKRMGENHMTFDEKARIVELFFTAVGLLLVIFGWIIPYRQALKADVKRKQFEEDILKRQWEKEFVDRQIEDFYGPISALLNDIDIRFALILYQLGRGHVFESEKYKLSDLPENDRLIWKHYVDTYKIPSQNNIVDIIKCNQHLIYKSEIPTCFKSFLQYAIGWELLDNQKRNNVPNYYEYYYSYNFPVEFTMYINDTLKVLLKKQQELIVSDKYPSTAY